MWDAKENYWSGHEWDSDDPWQPRENSKKDTRYPRSKSAHGARWYNDGSGAFEAFVNPLFKKLPKAQEIAWYVMKGDAHWDNTTTWKALGNTYTGGIWLKKLSVIANDVHKTPSDLKRDYPEGINVSETSIDQNGPLKTGKPAKIDDYFFLPALGFWYEGALYFLGSSGFYWSSSSDPFSKDKAYSLYFSSTEVKFGNSGYRKNGFVAQPFE